MTMRKKSVKTSAGQFEMLSEKFQSQYNQTTLSLQYCKLVGEEKEKSCIMDVSTKSEGK